VSGAVRALLKKHGLHLSRDLGQNFLVDERVAERLAVLAGVGSDDLVIEVGTGLGVLTRALASRAARVVSVEIDSGLVRVLKSEALLPENVRLIHADALKLDLAELITEGLAEHEGPVRLVANLPYSAATPLLRRLLDLRHRLTDWSVMVQRELADRISADVGTRDYGSFAVLHKLTVDVQTQLELAPGSFFPAPRVHSSFVRIWPLARSPLRSDGPDELPSVERVVRAAFSQRRKTIVNSLRSGGFAPRGERELILEALSEADIDPGARAETVEPERLLALSRALQADGEGGVTEA
jgi:16S rRNA (adenine1518-N6/adenine1519-N6)-dimethyltransferase